MTFKANLTGTGAAGAHAAAIVGGASVGLVATGSTIADALPLQVSNNQFTTVAAGTGAGLPNFMQVGDTVRIYNNGANALLVYPLAGHAINNGAMGAGFSVGVNKAAQFVKLSETLIGVILSA